MALTDGQARAGMIDRNGFCMKAPSADEMLHGKSHPGRGPGLLWLLTALSLAVALAIPFFLVDVPPVLDYPNHLARYFILAHPDDPVLSQMYVPRWGLMPNLGMDVLGAGLLKVASVHVGGRMLLALSVFAPVIGVIAYSRVAFGRFLYWPLASGVVAYNGIFHLGFMNFLLSLGLAFAAAAGWVVLRRRGYRWIAAAFGAVAVTVLFFCHLFGVLLFALLIGADEIARLLKSRRANTLTASEVMRTGVLLALAIGPALALYLASPLSAGAAAPAAIGSVDYKLWALLTPFMTTNIDLTLWTAVIVVAFIGVAWRSAILAPGFAIAFAILALVYVVAPSEVKGGTFVDIRLALMIGLLLFAGMQPRLPARLGMVVGLIFAALIGVRTIYIATTWIGHRHDLADLRTAMAPVMPGSRVLVARGRPGNRTNVERPERALPGIFRLDGQLGALLVVERRAFWPLMFADPAQQPLEVMPAFKPISQSPGEPVAWPLLAETQFSEAMLKDARYLKDWRSHFDAVLLIDPPAMPTPLPEGLTLVQAAPFAVLYRIQPR
ncbi:hypothetical protein V1281_001155 [Nitrobacteraceae bacterium AZCC 2161]